MSANTWVAVALSFGGGTFTGFAPYLFASENTTEPIISPDIDICKNRVDDLEAQHSRELSVEKLALEECNGISDTSNRTLKQCLEDQQILRDDIQVQKTALDASVSECEKTNLFLRTNLQSSQSQAREEAAAQTRAEMANCTLARNMCKQELGLCGKNLTGASLSLAECSTREKKHKQNILAVETALKAEVKQQEDLRMKASLSENTKVGHDDGSWFDGWKDIVLMVVGLLFTVLWKRRAIAKLTSENNAVRLELDGSRKEVAAFAAQAKSEHRDMNVEALEQECLDSNLHSITQDVAACHSALDRHDAEIQQEFCELENQKNCLAEHVCLLEDQLSMEKSEKENMQEKYKRDLDELNAEYTTARKNFDKKYQELLDMIREETQARQEIEKEMSEKDCFIASYEEELKVKNDLAAQAALASTMERQYRESQESIRLLEVNLSAHMQEKAEMEMQSQLHNEQMEEKLLQLKREEAKVSKVILVKESLEEEVQLARDNASRLAAELNLAHVELAEARSLHANVKHDVERKKNHDELPPISPANTDVAMEVDSTGENVADINAMDVDKATMGSLVEKATPDSNAALEDTEVADVDKASMEDSEQTVGQYAEHTVVVDAEFTVAEDSEQTVVKVAELTVADDAEQTVAKDSKQTVAVEAEQSVAGDFKKTVAEDTEWTVVKDAEQIVVEDSEQTVAVEAEQTVAEDLKQTVAEDTEQTVVKDAEQTLAEDLEQSVAEDTEQTVAEDTEQTVVEDVSNSIVDTEEALDGSAKMENAAQETRQRKKKNRKAKK